MPAPTVKKGKWSKERDRTQSGRWRKKRSDAGEPKGKGSAWKYLLAGIGIVVLAFLMVYFFFPSLLPFR